MLTRFDPERMYTYVKGFATAMGWKDTISALAFAREKHRPQKRKDGQPYITHPLTMACHALALGIREDSVAAACLLHDVVEDCGVPLETLPVSEETRDAVRRLTHVKGEPLGPYYREISEDPVSALVKCLDRCHNVSSMADAFSPEKIMSYIQETREYVLPLLRTAKDHWPVYSDALFVLKYHITSVVDSLDCALRAAGYAGGTTQP